MSKLLINENPLVLLPSLAVAIGLNQALFLQQVHYWLQTSKTTHNDKKWTYNTVDEWHSQFPFFSKSTINRAISDLVSSGLLIVDKLSDNKHDRTNYYTIDYVKLERLSHKNDKTHCVNLTQSNEPNWLNVTETSTENNTNINIKSELAKKEQSTIDNLTKDTRKRFAMTLDWIPNKQFFAGYCPSRLITPEQLTNEVLSKFREEAHSKGDIKTEADWCLCLAKRLSSVVVSGQTTKTKNQYQSPQYATPPELKPIITPPPPKLTPEQKAQIDKEMAELIKSFGRVA